VQKYDCKVLPSRRFCSFCSKSTDAIQSTHFSTRVIYSGFLWLGGRNPRHHRTNNMNILVPGSDFGAETHWMIRFDHKLGSSRRVCKQPTKVQDLLTCLWTTERQHDQSCLWGFDSLSHTHEIIDLAPLRVLDLSGRTNVKASSNKKFSWEIIFHFIVHRTTPHHSGAVATLRRSRQK